MKEEQQASKDLQTENFRQDDDSMPAEVNGDKIYEHTNVSDLQTEEEKQSRSQLEGGVASGFYSNDPKKTVNMESTTSLRAMADTHSASLPKPGRDDDRAPPKFSWPVADTNHGNVLDTIELNHQLQNTQSMPVWMPSVVATTISDDAEELAFGNIGDISLDGLRDDVDNVYRAPTPRPEPPSGMVF